MRILNLYSGIGGNRKLWGDEHEIVAVEIDPKIADIYEAFFPKDKMVLGDAHQYLLDNFKEFDFIWSSPPCQTHASFRYNLAVRFRGSKPEYPDMNLYQEILFLRHHFEGKWIVENVRPYYEPLIPPTVVLQRHLFWVNFPLYDEEDFKKDGLRYLNKISDFEELHGFDLSPYNLPNKRQILRNCVSPELGKYILDVVEKRPKEKIKGIIF